MRHGPFALPTIQYSKPLQAQQFLGATCCSTNPIPYIADWSKIGDYRQRQTDLNTARENKHRVDYDYKVGDKVLIRKDGILRKSESRYDSEPWTITSVHTDGTIRVERGTKSERINIRRVTPYFRN